MDGRKKRVRAGNRLRDQKKEADSYIWTWLLEGVTEGVGYEVLRARGIPCGKDYYYDRYRKFFWLLDRGDDYILQRL